MAHQSHVAAPRYKNELKHSLKRASILERFKNYGEVAWSSFIHLDLLVDSRLQIMTQLARDIFQSLSILLSQFDIEWSVPAYSLWTSFRLEKRITRTQFTRSLAATLLAPIATFCNACAATLDLYSASFPVVEVKLPRRDQLRILKLKMSSESHRSVFWKWSSSTAWRHVKISQNFWISRWKLGISTLFQSQFKLKTELFH